KGKAQDRFQEPLSSLQLEPGNLFDDVEQIAQLCRFNDCEHRSEPGCAIANAYWVTRSAQKQRGPSQRRGSSLLEEMTRSLGGRLRGFVVDAIPERDVALRDPIQDVVCLRLRDLFFLGESR